MHVASRLRLNLGELSLYSSTYTGCQCIIATRGLKYRDLETLVLFFLFWTNHWVADDFRRHGVRVTSLYCPHDIAWWFALLPCIVPSRAGHSPHSGDCDSGAFNTVEFSLPATCGLAIKPRGVVLGCVGLGKTTGARGPSTLIVGGVLGMLSSSTSSILSDSTIAGVTISGGDLLCCSILSMTSIVSLFVMAGSTVTLLLPSLVGKPVFLKWKSSPAGTNLSLATTSKVPGLSGRQAQIVLMIPTFFASEFLTSFLAWVSRPFASTSRRYTGSISCNVRATFFWNSR